MRVVCLLYKIVGHFINEMSIFVIVIEYPIWAIAFEFGELTLSERLIPRDDDGWLVMREWVDRLTTLLTIQLLRGSYSRWLRNIQDEIFVHDFPWLCRLILWEDYEGFVMKEWLDCSMMLLIMLWLRQAKRLHEVFRVSFHMIPRVDMATLDGYQSLELTMWEIESDVWDCGRRISWAYLPYHPYI